jgi:hypothetical protein
LSWFELPILGSEKFEATGTVELVGVVASYWEVFDSKLVGRNPGKSVVMVGSKPSDASPKLLRLDSTP